MGHNTSKAGNRTDYEPTRAATSIEGLPVMLSCEQAAQVAGVSRKHIRNLLAAGELHGIRLGTAWRIPRDAFLQGIGLLEA